jgi:hypothetical protein
MAQIKLTQTHQDEWLSFCEAMQAWLDSNEHNIENAVIVDSGENPPSPPPTPPHS